MDLSKNRFACGLIIFFNSDFDGFAHGSPAYRHDLNSPIRAFKTKQRSETAVPVQGDEVRDRPSARDDKRDRAEDSREPSCVTSRRAWQRAASNR
jgi:hypothetical protein